MKTAKSCYGISFSLLMSCSNPTLNAIDVKIPKLNSLGADVASSKMGAKGSESSFGATPDELMRPVQISVWLPAIGFFQQSEQDEGSNLEIKKQKMRVWTLALEVAEKISQQRNTTVVVFGADAETCQEISKTSESKTAFKRLKIDIESCSMTKDLSPLAFSRSFLSACRGDPANPIASSLVCKLNTSAAAPGMTNPFLLMAAEQVSKVGAFDAPTETYSVQIFPPVGLDSRLYPTNLKPTAAATHKSGDPNRTLAVDVTNQKACVVGSKEKDYSLPAQLRIETKGTSLPLICENWAAQQNEMISKTFAGSRKKVTLPDSFKSSVLANIKIGDAILSPASYRYEDSAVEFLQDPVVDKETQKITLNFSQ